MDPEEGSWLTSQSNYLQLQRGKWQRLPSSMSCLRGQRGKKEKKSREHRAAGGRSQRRGFRRASGGIDGWGTGVSEVIEPGDEWE